MTLLLQILIVLAASRLLCRAQGNLTTHIRCPKTLSSQAVQPNYPATASLLTCYHQAHVHLVRNQTDDEPSSVKAPADTEYPWYERTFENGFSISTKHYPRGSTEQCAETMIRVADNNQLQMKMITVYIDVRDPILRKNLTTEERFEFVFGAPTTSPKTTTNSKPSSPAADSSQQVIATVTPSTVLGALLGVAVVIIAILVIMLIRTKRNTRRLGDLSATGGGNKTTGSLEAQRLQIFVRDGGGN